MLSIESLKYDDNTIASLNEWQYGTNWPSVYIFYNETSAYVGETLDAIRRTEQHKQEHSFDVFTDVCFISDKTFNKSVILDLESFLIKYMSADRSKSLINGNAGIVDHNYFYREAYEDEFKEIWNELKKRGIVSQTLVDIENSDFYKYSPYKTLFREQYSSVYEILRWLSNSNNATSQSLIEVTGGAGTGKTILAVFLLKLLTDLSTLGLSDKSDMRYSWEIFDELGVGGQRVTSKLSGIKDIGFVVPMKELRNKMKEVFDTVKGLNSKMIISPEEAIDRYYDLLVVDEAHRLYYRNHLPGQQLYAKFDRVNRQLMGESFSTDPNIAYTELDWIIKSSRLQILFFDEYQRIRTADIPQSRFDAICAPRLVKRIELFSQMRCKGGNGYYEYVKTVLEGVKLDKKEYRIIENYSFSTVDSLDELYSKIDEFEKKFGFCKVLAGPVSSLNKETIIDGHTLRWGENIVSIHKIQGFDLNYAGVIFGKEVYYDKIKGCICINKNELKDGFMKSGGDESTKRYILNLYLTLMTRGINGTYVYAADDNLREYFRYFFR